MLFYLKKRSRNLLKSITERFTRVEITTQIDAPAAVVFDLSRRIDVHLQSTQHTGEKAIAGRTGGLIELGEWVTWQATHFGIKQKLTSKITEYNYPHYFTDEMLSGAFKGFRHEHYFTEVNGQTLMADIFTFEVPLWIPGRVFGWLILSRYMMRLLDKRNALIKEIAENTPV